MPCTQCGEEGANGQRFCHGCGYSLAEGGAEPPKAETGRGRSGLFGESLKANISFGSAMRALQVLVVSAYRTVGMGWLDKAREESGRRASVRLDEHSGERGTSEAVDSISPEQIAQFGPAAAVRANVLFGVLAIFGAVGGQWLLGRGQTVAAVGLFGAATLLALWAFRRSTDFALPAVGQFEQLRQLDPLWLLPTVFLPGAAAAWSVDQLLTNPDRPPDLFWQLHWVSVLLLIGCVFVAQRALGRRDSGLGMEGRRSSSTYKFLQNRSVARRRAGCLDYRSECADPTDHLRRAVHAHLPAA